MDLERGTRVKKKREGESSFPSCHTHQSGLLAQKKKRKYS